MHKFPRHIDSVTALKNEEVLRAHFGNFSDCQVATMETGGFSGATFEKLTLHYPDGDTQQLVLKKVTLDEDWFSYRTHDQTGREAAILVEPELQRIHQIFHLPYHLAGMEPSAIGLLMEDVSKGLFPDERKPIAADDQDLILDSLAKMHAHFWESPALKSCAWLQTMQDFIYLMGPLDHPEYEGVWAESLPQTIKKGWATAMTILPEKLKTSFQLPPGKIIESWHDLPKTLVHGDTKVANFAKAMDGKLCLLDWAFAGYAPCTFDLGWFLAVNASRLAGDKEAIIDNYRALLEQHLGHKLENQLWQQLEQAGIVCGAFMLLWSKALAVKAGRPGSKEEWQWWVERLEAWDNQ